MDHGGAAAAEFMGFVTRTVVKMGNAGEEGRVTQEDQDAIERVKQSLSTVVALQRDIASRPVDPALQYYVFHSIQAMGNLVDGLFQLRDQEFRRFRKDVTDRLKRLEEKPKEPSEHFF